MGRSSSVPPSQRSSGTEDRPAGAETADRSADTAAETPALPHERAPQEAGPPTAAAGGGAGEAPALPRRVRGTNGARKPAKVEPPLLPASFLERVRAAAAASQAEDAAGEMPASAPARGAAGGVAPVRPPAVQPPAGHDQEPAQPRGRPAEGSAPETSAGPASPFAVLPRRTRRQRWPRAAGIRAVTLLRGEFPRAGGSGG